MPIFESLAKEHQLIRRYLDNVHLVLECMKAGQVMSTSFFLMGLEFTRTFSDTYHHYGAIRTPLAQPGSLLEGAMTNVVGVGSEKTQDLGYCYALTPVG